MHRHLVAAVGWVMHANLLTMFSNAARETTPFTCLHCPAHFKFEHSVVYLSVRLAIGSNPQRPQQAHSALDLFTVKTQ